MHFKTHAIDTSDDLRVYRFNNGIKLVRPEMLASNLGWEVGHSLSIILALPFPISLETTESVTKRCKFLSNSRRESSA